MIHSSVPIYSRRAILDNHCFLITMVWQGRMSFLKGKLRGYENMHVKRKSAG